MWPGTLRRMEATPLRRGHYADSLVSVRRLKKTADTTDGLHRVKAGPAHLSAGNTRKESS